MGCGWRVGDVTGVERSRAWWRAIGGGTAGETYEGLTKEYSA